MIRQRLDEDLKAAMRARDEARLRTIRSLRAALLEKEISERQGGEAQLSEEQELLVVQKQAKQRREAIEQYRSAGRDDLVQKESEELAVIEQYLPEQLDDAAVLQILTEVVTDIGATSMKDIGKVMPEAMKRLKGKVDGRRVQQLVQSVLAGPR